MIVYVVIVTYNPKKWIDKCFLSLRSSTIPVSTIVIDNGSVDGSVDVIEKNYPEVEVIRSPENVGFGKANNIGIKRAYDKGSDFVFLLNQDAWIEPDTIEKLLNAAQKEPEYGVISPIHLNGSGDAFDDKFLNCISNDKCKGLLSDVFLKKIKDSVYPVKFVNAAAWFLSRKCIETIGGFSPSFFHYSEDDNYVHRLLYHNLKIGVLPKAVIFHDRETRIGNVYFDDWRILYKRRSILRASNPLEEFSITKEIKNQLKELAVTLLSFNYKGFLAAYYKLKMLYSVEKNNILANKKLSKEPGLLFL